MKALADRQTRNLERRGLDRSTRTVGAVALAVGLTACGGGDGLPAVRDAAPQTPAGDVAGYQVGRLPGWHLIGDALTPEAALAVEVTAPGDTPAIDVFVGDLPGVRLERIGDGRFAADLDLTALPAGEHAIVLAEAGADVGVAARALIRSAPLYVVLSNDWDDPDNTDEVLALQEDLHARHPELILTHFVGPYTFTDPSVSPERRARLVEWLRGLEAEEGDEIGLHIHPYCTFVEAAGVECNTEPSVVYFQGDATGYSVMLNSYAPDELDALFAGAAQIFADHGLPRATSFRAGAWIADREVLGALARAGFVADTSANNWMRMEEWEGVQNGVIYDWNKTHWSTIGDTSQPYFPSVADVQVPGDPHVGILEVPDNGIMVDYVTRDEMIAIFDANFDGTPLHEPRAYSIGYHPSNFTSLFRDRLHYTLLHVEQHLASAGRGPVVFARLSDLAQVWPAP